MMFLVYTTYKLTVLYVLMYINVVYSHPSILASSKFSLPFFYPFTIRMRNEEWEGNICGCDWIKIMLEWVDWKNVQQTEKSFAINTSTYGKYHAFHLLTNRMNVKSFVQFFFLASSREKHLQFIGKIFSLSPSHSLTSVLIYFNDFEFYECLRSCSRK